MKVLVTGGAGFIGSHIVDQLIAVGHDVVILDNMSTGKETHLHPQAAFYRMDIGNPQVVKVFQMEKPNIVIHQAAQTVVQTSVQKPLHDAQTNILGTINLLEACRIAGVEKFIYASSAAVYGDPKYVPIDEQHPVNPLSAYGVSKYTPEQYLHIYYRLYGMKYTILRYANVYGVRQDPQGEGGVISIFIDKVIQQKPCTIYGDGEQTRDYIYVEDVARANIAALQQGDGCFFNIGTGVRTTLNQLIYHLQLITGLNTKVLYKAERPGDIKHSYFSIDKAVNEIAWSPKVKLTDGLQKTYHYCLEQHSTNIL